jgi:hypothetical protein
MPLLGRVANGIGGQSNASDSMPDLTFVPQELTVQCCSLIEKYHKIHGYSCLPDMLWYADSREIIRSHKELRKIFKQASMARGMRQANHSLLFVATVIMAVEGLVRNFAAWGAQFPAARQQAEKLLGASPASQRVWFMDTYLNTSHGIDRDSVIGFALRANTHASFDRSKEASTTLRRRLPQQAERP